jgi:hypothetical protein
MNYRYPIGLVLILMVVCFGDIAFGQSGTLAKKVVCNASQEKCLIRTTRATIGDEVLFFKPGSNRTVASGEVTSIKKDIRIVEIDRRTADIPRDAIAKLRRAEDSQYNWIESAKSGVMGLSLGLGFYDYFSTTQVIDVSAFYEFQSSLFGIPLARGLGMVLRASGHIGSNDEVDYTDEFAVPINNGTLSVTSMGLSFGPSYTGLEFGSFGFRLEGNAGFQYSLSKLDDRDDYEDLAVVRNDDLRAIPGIQFAAGGQIALYYGVKKKLRPYLGAGFNIVGPAKGSTVFLGIMHVR